MSLWVMRVGIKEGEGREESLWVAEQGLQASCQQIMASRVGSCSVELPFLPSRTPPSCLPSPNISGRSQ